ncbi:hypothetical protein [Pseudomonas sp. R5(2019)]|uniref:hypothetical protein n=1 Tax=Pseudomonas sp. R5(2019) TaxID=2697566 RepID=UPI001412B66E|nr:hypothetical protein [Pseudomonas sp. R5(2019)]NBA93597.1 hypothetical protein [Pseudomonas sp. R5(2019)]
MLMRLASASNRIELCLWAGRNLLVTGSLLTIAFTSSAQSQLTTPDAKGHTCSTEPARFEVGQQSLDAARKAYPAAALVPESMSGWEKLSNVVEENAPGDEGTGGLSANGVKLYGRNKDCFPTEPRNLFSEVDKVIVGSDLSPRPIDYNEGKGVPEHARQAIKGQNTWMLWGEGNEAFWGWLQQNGYGIADFLILLDSRKRDTRFEDAGLMNQPGMIKRETPIDGLGLYLDQADGDNVKMIAPKDDIDAETQTPVEPQKPPTTHKGESFREFFEVGDKDSYKKIIDQLANDGVDPLVYGYPSGVVGLRLMPNPDFFGRSDTAIEARRYWQQQVVDNKNGGSEAYYSSEGNRVSADPKLVRPFRVAMACSFCHVGPHPLSPPGNLENPAWGNMSSTIGNQYWRPEKAFSNLRHETSFLWQFVASQQPGTIDTSLISTDHINNPNTINAIFEVNPRLARAGLNPPEQQSPANLEQRGIEDDPDFKSNPRHTPRVLLDGSDSIGVEGALSRVYLNIGAYSEQWNRLHNPVIGFKPQRPFELATIKNKSVYWQATEEYRIPQLESFFTYVSKTGASVTQPMKLESIPEGRARIDSKRADALDGRTVFLKNCAVCHSSKQPPDQQFAFSREWRLAKTGNLSTLTMPMDFTDWEAFKLSDKYLDYLKSLFAYEIQESALERDLFKDNYLSTDIRVPITLVGTNSQRAVATNAMRGQVWDNFSSETYKSLPAVGRIRFFNPFKSAGGVDEWGNNDSYVPPPGGPGYYRPASLVGLWATAPFLHNNALGIFNNDPSVKGRLDAFDDAIDRLLNKNKRVAEYTNPKDLRTAMDFRQRFAGDTVVAGTPGFSDSGLIYRTTARSEIDFRGPFIRPLLNGVLGDTATSIIALYLWLALAAISLVLVFIGRARLAASALLLLMAVTAVLLRITGVDSIYPWLWAIPAVALLAAFGFLLRPRSILAPRLFFGASTVVFLAVGLFANAYVDGHISPIEIRPIPKGTPVNLIMNMNPQAPVLDLVRATSALTRAILRVRKDDLLDDEPTTDQRPAGHFQALAAFQEEAGPALLKVSKCPDFVADRGHWFGEYLSDVEKKQLKAFLETF